MRVKMLDLKNQPAQLKADQLEVGNTYYLVTAVDGELISDSRRSVFLVVHTSKTGRNMAINLSTNIALEYSELGAKCRFVQCCTELLVDLLPVVDNG